MQIATRERRRVVTQMFSASLHAEKYFSDLATSADIRPLKPVDMKIFNKRICYLIADCNNFSEEKFQGRQRRRIPWNLC